VEDTKLWENIRKGDKGALKILHKKYYHQMYLYAVKSTGVDINLAEELVSDCFIKIWESRSSIQIHYSLRQYIYLMLHNLIIDYFRKKRIRTVSLTEDIRVPLDIKEFDDQKQYATLYQLLDKLPPQCRRILDLAIFESLTYNEIALKLQISKNTVKTQIGRAYRFLKENLDPNDFNFFILVLKNRGFNQ
jgi:RNA polymerase sigma-70 factor (ECF subfamily)